MSGLIGGRSVTTRADKISAFQSTTCDFGTPLPIAYGTCKLSPNLINFQKFTANKHKSSVKTGKFSKSTTIDYTYEVYVELALCEGIIDGISRVYVGDDSYSSLTRLNAKSTNIGAPLNLNPGDNPNPTAFMQTYYPSLAIGYNNMAYLYGFIYLGDSAGMPSYSFEVQGACRNSGDGTDANPADIILDLLGRVGCAGYADTESFENFRTYCKEANLLVSTPADAFTQQRKCQEYVKELLQICNAYMFWSVDRFKIVVRDDIPRGNWRPNTTVCYDITTKDMKAQNNGACVSYTRKDSSALYNRWGVSFTNRASGYEEEKVFYEDVDDIIAHGVRTAPDFSARWIHTKERAVIVASMQARINQTENVKYTFKLPWGKGSLLEPGDLITLTDDAIGLDKQLCMVDNVSEDAVGLLTVTALRREAVAEAVAYDVHDIAYNTFRYNAEPGDIAVPLVITPPQELISASSGIELWLALHGETEDWGGCNVYTSTKDGSYAFYSAHNRNSNYGYTLNAISTTSTSVDVHFTNVETVNIIDGTDENKQAGLTDIWINGECMAYGTSELIGPNSYRLGALERGKYSTKATNHNTNEGFALLDGELFTIQLTKKYLNKNLYMKFPSFNTFEKSGQELTDVQSYVHQVRLYDIPNVTNLTAVAKYETREDAGGETPVVITRRYAEVNWSAPDWASYMNAKVYYRTATGAWRVAGIGTSSLTFDVTGAGDYVIAVCSQDSKSNSETPDVSTQVNVSFI